MRFKSQSRRSFLKTTAAGALGIGSALAIGNTVSLDAEAIKHTASVGKHKGRTALLIDGEPVPGIAILGQPSWAKDVDKSSVKALCRCGNKDRTGRYDRQLDRPGYVGFRYRFTKAQ